MQTTPPSTPQSHPNHFINKHEFLLVHGCINVYFQETSFQLVLCKVCNFLRNWTHTHPQRRQAVHTRTTPKHMAVHFLVVLSFFNSISTLRDAYPFQNGWIFGKVPNGLWPPPHFRKVMLQIFSEIHDRSIVYNGKNLQHKFLDWKWPPTPLWNFSENSSVLEGVSVPYE